MAASTSEQEGSESGFVKDENGQWKMVPLKLPELMCDTHTTKTNSEKRKCLRKYIPIERLTFNPTDLDDSPKHLSKKYKTDKVIRKELFKVPQKKRLDTRSSFNNRQLRKSENIFKRTSVNKKFFSNSKKNYQPISDGSPLLDIDEAEELLSKQKIIKNPPRIVINDASNAVRMTPQKTVHFKEKQTPSSNDSVTSDMEFLEIEKTFAQVIGTNEKTIKSPMTSMCALLENTKINNSSDKFKEKSNTAIDELLILIKEEKDEFKKFQKRHQENLDKIEELLIRLKNCESDENKENQNRKPDRIASLTLTKEKRKYNFSPAVLKSVDLRKAALNKNLKNNLQYEVQSPRMKRAVEMYNSFRNDCKVLCTPKMDRTIIDVHQASVTRSLSRRVQQQCLLLQDTPKKQN